MSERDSPLIAYVDFNSSDEHGLVFCRAGSMIRRGARVLLRDHEGNWCEATKVGTSRSGLALMRLDIETWVDSSEDAG